MKTRIASLIAAAAVVLTPGVAMARTNDDASHVVTGQHVIPVQVIRVGMIGQPVPDKKKVNSSVSWAANYWSTLTEGDIDFDVTSDSVLNLDLSAGKFGTSAFDSMVSKAEDEGDIPDRPANSVQMFIHNTDAGLSWAITKEETGGIVQIHGDKVSIAHELGHILGLGHSRAYINLGDDQVLGDYANGWSLMGGGSGVPDGSQLAALGLLKQQNIVTDKTYKLYALGEFQKAGIHSLTWNYGNTSYTADFRSANRGLDTVPNDETNAVLYVTTSVQIGGEATTKVMEIKSGQERRVGGLWLAPVMSKDKSFANVSVS